MPAPVPAQRFGLRDRLSKVTMDGALGFVGRAAVAHLFLRAGYFHLTSGWRMTVDDMASRGLPLPELLNVGAMILSGGMALALLLDFKARWAALGLALYTLVVSSAMYTPVPGVSPQVFILFIKDMAIFGGLLAFSCALAANERRKRARQD